MKRSRPGGQSHRDAFYIFLDVLRLNFLKKFLTFWFYMINYLCK